jgi:hypothetical protein
VQGQRNKSKRKNKRKKSSKFLTHNNFIKSFFLPINLGRLSEKSKSL